MQCRNEIAANGATNERKKIHDRNSKDHKNDIHYLFVCCSPYGCSPCCIFGLQSSISFESACDRARDISVPIYNIHARHNKIQAEKNGHLFLLFFFCSQIYISWFWHRVCVCVVAANPFSPIYKFQTEKNCIYKH